MLLAATSGSAEVSYKVSPASDLSYIKIRMEVPCQGATIDLSLPNWSPGYYVLENYSESLKDVEAVDEKGLPLTLSHPTPDTWHVDTLGAKLVRVTYSKTVFHENGRMGIFSSDDETIHYGGASTYLYVVGRKTEPCRLSFELASEWKLAVGLEPTSRSEFVAQNYDVLADSPVTIGKFRTATYTVRGKTHILAIRGSGRDKLNLDRAVKMTRFISTSESGFFGEAPYALYVWHIWAGDTADGAGGLEHASSSQDYMSLKEGPASMRGLAHECFHLWNVKRIRSSALGPFNYNVLPRTGALWWLEGVTDYYASLIPHRYGWYGDEEYLRDLSRQIRDVRQNPERLKVSPYESSLRVGETAGGRGNSNGFGVDYYPTGWMLGLMFDIELRTRSNGSRSLDDVELALWRMCKGGKPGFQEDELRRQLVRFGGAELGDLYDLWVMHPGDLPYESELAKVGLEVQSGGGHVTVIESNGASPDQKLLREGWFWGKRNRPSKLVD